MKRATLLIAFALFFIGCESEKINSIVAPTPPTEELKELNFTRNVDFLGKGGYTESMEVRGKVTYSMKQVQAELAKEAAKYTYDVSLSTAAQLTSLSFPNSSWKAAGESSHRVILTDDQNDASIVNQYTIERFEKSATLTIEFGVTKSGLYLSGIGIRVAEDRDP